MKILINPKTLTFTFEIPAMPSTNGVQKILGFSRGWHHWNSVRLGIRKENDYCVLYLYAYVRGERIIKRMGKVSIGVEVKAELRFNEGYVSIDCYCGNMVIGSHTHTDVPMWTFPVGYLLNSYMEKDTNKHDFRYKPKPDIIPFDVRIWDIKCNGKVL
jgi:hypothetical protein